MFLQGLVFFLQHHDGLVESTHKILDLCLPCRNFEGIFLGFLIASERGIPPGDRVELHDTIALTGKHDGTFLAIEDLRVTRMIHKLMRGNPILMIGTGFPPGTRFKAFTCSPNRH